MDGRIAGYGFRLDGMGNGTMFGLMGLWLMAIYDYDGLDGGI